MNKNSKLMIIYDDNNHKSNLDENNIIYWNDYAHGDKSILNLIEKNSTTLKKELTNQLDKFYLEVQYKFQGLNINIDKDVSFWSINSLVDNNNIYDETFINEYIKFKQLKKIIIKNQITNIIFHTNNNELINKLHFFEKEIKVKINVVKNKSFKIKKSYIKKIIHPVFLAFPIFLIFLFKRLKFFKKIENQKKIRENLFINYFNEPSISNGNFYSEYWGNLDTLLEKYKIKRTWLHISVPKKENISFELIKKLNTNPLSEHIMLDSLFNLRIFLKIMFSWLKVVFNFNKINKELKKNLGNKFLYLFFKNNFYENIFGYKFFINLYYFNLLKLLIKNESKLKCCFYLFENQSWERSLIYNLNQNSTKIKKFGVIHSSVRFWDLRYVKMQNLCNDINLKKFFHEKIIVSSETFKSILIENNYKDEIILAETLRYQDILNFNKEIYLIKNKNEIIILGDYSININKKMEDCVEYLLNINKFKVICKPHPLNDFSKKLYKKYKIIKSSEKISDLSKKFNNFIVPNTSTVGLELYLMGKNVITVLDNNLINYSPLKNYYNYQNYLYDLNQIEQKIYNDSENQSYLDFFKKNNFFKEWKNIINND